MNAASSKSSSSTKDPPAGSGPRLTPPAFGRDCTVGDRLQLRCLWRAVGEYMYARHGARRLRVLRRNILHEHPDATRREVMILAAMQWSGIERPQAEALVRGAQDTFTEWPTRSHTSFQHFAIYLLVSEYLRTRCAMGTQVDMQRIIAKHLPGEP